jgi:hypothetical protein
MTRKEEREKLLERLHKRYENYDNFSKDAGTVAKNYVIIKRCRECHGPVIDGYCCTICDSDNP